MTAPTPLRSGDEVVGAIVPITLGGQEFRLAELPRRANREWTSRFTIDVRDKLLAIGPLDSADEVIRVIAESSEQMMDLLLSYDAAGAKAWSEVRGIAVDPALPEREWIDTRATDGEVYAAFRQVLAAAFPTVRDLIRLVPEFMPMLLASVQKGIAAATVALSLSMSSARPSTAGSPKKSKAA